MPMRLLFGVVLLAHAALAPAQTPSPAATPPCSAAEQHQFDFWVGDWDVFRPDGAKVGENRIDRVAGGCALLENWAGRGGIDGKSLNAWDAADKRWHQTWVDASGGVLMLAGGWSDGRMVLGADQPGANGAVLRQRITWTPLADGAVRQHWETSADSGATWATSFDGRYVRKAAAPRPP